MDECHDETIRHRARRRHRSRRDGGDRSRAVPADHPRKLSIEAPGLTRPGTTDPIPADQITLVPETLAPQQTTFHFRVEEDGLPSGVYTGRVRVGDNGEYVDVAIRL